MNCQKTLLSKNLQCQ